MRTPFLPLFILVLLASAARAQSVDEFWSAAGNSGGLAFKDERTGEMLIATNGPGPDG
jgi:hypothetical protein